MLSLGGPAAPRKEARGPAFAKTEFATDSLLEGTGFEPSVPLLRKALLGVANRRRRHERQGNLQVQARDGNACFEWLPIAFPFAGDREFESVFLHR